MDTTNLLIDHKFIVEPRWVHTCLGESSEELFSRSCIGYWARGVAYKVKSPRGPSWLIYEDSDKAHRHGDEPDNGEAMMRFMEHSSLRVPGPISDIPPDKYLSKWHIIDLAIVKAAWLEGLKLKGEKWFDAADGSFYDVVLQKALLGEVRYG